MTIAVSLDWQPIEVQWNIALTTVWIPPVPWQIDTSFDQWSGFNKQPLWVAEYWDEYVFWWDNGSNYYSAYKGVSSINSNKVSPFFRVRKDNKLPDVNSVTGGNFDNWNVLVNSQFVIDWWHIYVVWPFRKWNNTLSTHIIKLNTTDMSAVEVNTGVWFSSTSSLQIRYANGKVFVWWDTAATYNWGTSTRLNVFNDDLTIDSTLTNFFLPSGTITCVFEQADWKVVISGSFTTIWWTTQNRIVRYNTDWTVDATFSTNVWTWPNTFARDIRQLSDAKLVLWWTFTSFNATTSQRVIVLNTDWTIATAVASWFNWEINILAIDTSDNIFCWWFFQNYWWTSRLWLCKLSSTLVLDATYYPLFNTNARIYTLKIDGTDLYVWTSNFKTTVNWTNVWWVFSTDLVNWTLTSTFNWWAWTDWEIRKLEILWDYIYLHWWLSFTQYWWNRSFDWELVLFVSFVDKNWWLTKNLDKFYDTSWNSYNVTNCLKVWDDLYVTLTLSMWYWISTSKAIVKFVNKELDTSFNVNIPSNGINSVIYDNGVIVVGNFTSPTNRIVKFNNTGAVDATFNVWTGFNALFWVRCITKLSTWNYLVTWQFTTYKWVTTNRICVLDNTWTKVWTFVEGTWLDTWTQTKTLELSNWNYLVYWAITTYKSVACNRAIILDSTGTQISWLSSNFSWRINKAVEYNWKVYFTGFFTTFWATTVNNIACIDLATWTLENIFWTGLNGIGNDLIIDNWGKLLVVWNFTTYNSIPVWYVARIFI